MVTIEKSRSKKGQRKYLRITGKNGKKLVRSETMFKSAACRKNARAVYEQLKKVFEGGQPIVDNSKPKKRTTQ